MGNLRVCRLSHWWRPSYTCAELIDALVAHSKLIPAAGSIDYRLLCQQLIFGKSSMGNLRVCRLSHWWQPSCTCGAELINALVAHSKLIPAAGSIDYRLLCQQLIFGKSSIGNLRVCRLSHWWRPSCTCGAELIDALVAQ
jgi:hypothetical protein